jgi:crotonobetainyl-CoA:carnitine CoA-transferase CaiB-like acyl-CoA transferase
LLAADVACVVAAPGPVEANYLDDGSVGDVCNLRTTATNAIFDEYERLTPLVTMSRSGAVAGGSCMVGQHTDQVMTELGYDAEAIAELVARKVIGH